MPLVHIVCFKYKGDVDEAARADHRARLKALATLKGVLDLKVGADVVHAARSYDAGFIVTFPDRAALDAYQADPDHVVVARLGSSLCEHIVAVDFES